MGSYSAASTKGESLVESDDQSDAYYQAVAAITDRFKDEFDLTYANMMGVLDMYKMELFCEAMSVVMSDDEDDDEDDDDEGEEYKKA